MAPDDAQVWESVLSKKLDGVGFHSAMSQLASVHGLRGQAKMHKRHSIDEFETYSRLADEWATTYRRVPDVTMSRPNVSVDSQDKLDVTKSLVKMYGDWETNALIAMHEAYNKLHGDADELRRMEADVRSELDKVSAIASKVDMLTDSNDAEAFDARLTR